MAQEYADMCEWTHAQPNVTYDWPFDPLGQNLYYNNAAQMYDITWPIKRWHDEIEDFDYENNECRTDLCGHYTQVTMLCNVVHESTILVQ